MRIITIILAFLILDFGLSYAQKTSRILVNSNIDGKLLVDGAEYSISKSEMKTIEIFPGEHIYEFIGDSLKIEEKLIRVPQGEQKVLSFSQKTNMGSSFGQVARPNSQPKTTTNVPKPVQQTPKPKMFSGNSSILVLIPEAGELMIDYESVGTYNGPDKWKSQIQAGSHIVTFEHHGGTWEDEIECKPNTQELVKIDLEQKTATETNVEKPKAPDKGELLVESVQEGTVNINGDDVGTIGKYEIKKFMVSPGKAVIRITTPTGFTQRQEADIRLSQRETIYFDFVGADRGPKKFTGSSSLLVIFESDGVFSIDYEKVWSFKKGESYQTKITAGEHILKYKGSSVDWEKTIKCTGGQQTIVKVGTSK